MMLKELFNKLKLDVITDPEEGIVAFYSHKITDIYDKAKIDYNKLVHGAAMDPDLPLNRQAAIPSAFESWQFVSFNHILETGYIDTYEAALQNTNQKIDLNADDSFAKAWRDVREKVVGDLRRNPEMQNLMNLSSWTETDRKNYERHLAEAISKRVDDVPGLDTYRATSEGSSEGLVNLNDLSEDINNETKRIEFDCTEMSVFEGTLVQSIENRILANSEGLKAPHNYYYTSGAVVSIARQSVEAGDDDIKEGYHAYIVSSATGNIIESTSSRNIKAMVYQEMEGDFSFADHVAGRPALTREGHIYVSAGFSQDNFARRAQAIASGNLSALNDLRSPVQETKENLAAVVKNPEAFKPDYATSEQAAPPERAIAAGVKEAALGIGQWAQDTIDAIDRSISEGVDRLATGAAAVGDELMMEARNYISGVSGEEMSAPEDKYETGSPEEPLPAAEHLPEEHRYNSLKIDPESEKHMTGLVKEGVSVGRETVPENEAHDPQGIDGYTEPKTTGAFEKLEFFMDRATPIQSVVADADAETVVPEKSFNLGERGSITPYHRDLSDRVAGDGFDFKAGNGSVIRSSGAEMGIVRNGELEPQKPAVLIPEKPAIIAQTYVV